MLRNAALAFLGRGKGPVLHSTPATAMRARMNRPNVSLFLRYLAITLIPIFVLVATGTISIIINDRYVSRQIRESSARTLEQISNGVDFTFAELDSLDIILSSSSEFLAALSRILVAPDLDLEQSKLLSVLQNFVNVSAFARRDVESIYVYIANNRDRFMSTTDGLVDLAGYSDRDWFFSFLSHDPGDASWTESRVLNRLPAVEQGRPVVTIFRRLYPLAGVRLPGVVVLNIHRRFFADLLDQMKGTPDQRIVILDEDGTVVYTDFPDAGAPWNGTGADAEGFRSVTAEGTRWVAARLASRRHGWTYLSFTPADRFFGVSRPLRLLNIAVVALAALGGTLVTFWASRRSFRSIEGVLDVVDAADRGGPLPPVPAKTDRGFSHVTYSILRTFLEHQYLRVQMSERRYRLKTLELLALQSQMNPHFLFNTLEAINWKAVELTRGPNRINDMIRDLSSILKYVLQSPSGRETLANEIKHARDYLRIQRVRFKGRFSVRWDLQDGLERRKVIRFLLQPLLENAIYHGLREKGDHGLITIRASETRGRLRIVVSDDGVGIPPRRLAEIRRRLDDEGGDAETGPGAIGLANTNRRIRLTFGTDYGLRVESEPGRGTSVTVELPSRK
jgi:two-component system sensor histidine kinase YesM